MPKILIKEVDQTAATGSAITDIAYVPGLMGCDAAGNTFTVTDKDGKDITPFNTPILCSTVKEFESYFGIKPGKMLDTYNNNTKDVMYNGVKMMTVEEKNNFDKSYFYAKELLSAGMPVVYEAIKAEANNELAVAMGSCKWNEDDSGYESYTDDATVRNNHDNTLSLIGAEGKKDIYIEIDTKGDNYYVTVDVGSNGKIEDIFCSGTNSELGNKLDNVVDAFVTTTRCYVVHVVFESTKAVTDLEFIRVMVNKNAYLPFEYLKGDSATNPVNYLYASLASRFDRLSDKSLYDVKYITAGGYPTFADTEKTLANKMISVAASRGDCVALPDHINEPQRPLVGPGSLYKAAIQDTTFSDGTYGAMFTPYAKYTCNTVVDAKIPALQEMPASFGYLMCLAKAIQTSPSWLAMAGVTRGVVPNIDSCTCKQTLSNVVADEYQPRSNGTSINAITNVSPYGLTVWGNRTLARAGDELKAVNFLNTRNMISDIKKQAYATARACMFEQDSDTMWLKFKSGMSPLLDNIKSGYGISNYKLIKSNTAINGDPLGKGQVAVVIKIYPIYAVEYFEISVVIADDVTVS